MPHPPSSTNTVTVSSKAPYNSFQSKSGMSEELKEIRATSLMVRFKSPSSESTPKLNLEDHLSGKRKVLRQIEFFEQMISAYDDSSSSLPPYNWKGERLPQGLRTSLKSSSSTALSGRNEGVVNSSSLLSQVAQHTTPLKVAVTELPSPLGDGALTVKAYAFTPKALSPSSQPSSASTQPNLAQSSLQNAKGTGIGETLQTNGSVNPYTNELRDQLKENKQQVTVLEEGFLKLLGNYDKKSANVLSMDDKAKADSNIGSIHRFIAEIYSERKKTKEALDSGNINAAKKYLKNVEIYTEACFKWLSKIENLNALKRTDSGSDSGYSGAQSSGDESFASLSSSQASELTPQNKGQLNQAETPLNRTRTPSVDSENSVESGYKSDKEDNIKVPKRLQLAMEVRNSIMKARKSDRLQQAEKAKEAEKVECAGLVTKMKQVTTGAKELLSSRTNLDPSSSYGKLIQCEVDRVILLAEKASKAANSGDLSGDLKVAQALAKTAEDNLKLLAEKLPAIDSFMQEVDAFQQDIIGDFSKQKPGIKEEKRHTYPLLYKRIMDMGEEFIDAAEALKQESTVNLRVAKKRFETIKDSYEKAKKAKENEKGNYAEFVRKVKKIENKIKDIQPNSEEGWEIKDKVVNGYVWKALTEMHSCNLKVANLHVEQAEEHLNTLVKKLAEQDQQAASLYITKSVKREEKLIRDEKEKILAEAKDYYKRFKKVLSPNTQKKGKSNISEIKILDNESSQEKEAIEKALRSKNIEAALQHLKALEKCREKFSSCLKKITDLNTLAKSVVDDQY